MAVNEAASTPEFDVIVIGAGMCGVIFLEYALDRGVRCLVLEKQDTIGGLWNRLPAWQDIQNRREDFSIDHVPIDGVRQLDVARHVREWVDHFDLGSSITLGQEVVSVEKVDEAWCVRTANETLRARYLVAASGVQNDAWIPDVERRQPSVVEHHSSSLQHPSDLRDRRVTVVGSGASALDLLDLAVQHDARTIDWVYRQPRWFMPTRRAKQRLWPNLREMAATQCMLRSPETMSAFLQCLLEREYDYFGLSDIEPTPSVRA
jgi:cation diffusion facilitator CzcD-associated flavoprotein CzcO